MDVHAYDKVFWRQIVVGWYRLSIHFSRRFIFPTVAAALPEVEPVFAVAAWVVGSSLWLDEFGHRPNATFIPMIPVRHRSVAVPDRIHSV